MKVNKKVNLMVAGLSIVTSLSIIGGTMGTLSWYAYSTRTSLSYTGTSIRKSVLLNIGIIDDDKYISNSTIANYHLERETLDGKSIVWTSSTSGLSGDVIREYLMNSPYAYNYLSPVTSNERALNADTELTLYKSPEFGKTTITEEADKKDYVKIPFAFKIMNTNDERVADQKIWLTDVDVRASGENLEDAVRVFVENNDEKFLFKPHDSTEVNKSTRVGGLLDLNGDKLYDYNIGDSNKEYVYGRYSGTPTFSPNASGTDYYENVNHVVDETDSTFYAQHSMYASVLNTESISFLDAHYYTFGTICPKVKDNGEFYSKDGIGRPITITNSEDAVGYVDLTIYLEGWDHAIIDTAAGCSFNLGLQFEINNI